MLLVVDDLVLEGLPGGGDLGRGVPAGRESGERTGGTARSDRLIFGVRAWLEGAGVGVHLGKSVRLTGVFQLVNRHYQIIVLY